MAPRNKIDEIRNFKFLAFDDYIAARKILLSNKEHRNGIILASTCVEKYFKAFLAFYDIKRPVHLGTELIKAVSKIGHDGEKLIGLMDKTFLNLLSDSYSLRYIDSATNKVNSFSFCVMQVVGELDYVANLMEHSISESGKLSDYYAKALNDKSHFIHELNFISNSQTKEFFMSQASPIYAIKIVNSTIIQLQGSVVVPGKKYDGNIRIPVKMVEEQVPRGKPFYVTYTFDCEMPKNVDKHTIKIGIWKKLLNRLLRLLTK